MDLQHELAERLRPRLAELYGPRAEASLARLLAVCSRYLDLKNTSRKHGWDERDVVLITYADQVQNEQESPLATLRKWLTSQGLQRVLRVLHLLPFFPATSDDGFSVSDYRQVDPSFGAWDDIAALSNDFDLMFDLVLNHASSQSRWFQEYLRGVEPYGRFFFEADPAEDLSQVVRPRSLPLLTPYETNRGQRHVWTTFSADQVDLNFAEPLVLAEMVDILLSYIRRGARIIRLDAIAYLWKQPGTTSIHLPQTHTVVKLLRDVLDVLAPGVLLLTETNVPHKENVSYWGNADEAHLIYNFTLPPLLLEALLTGDGTYLHRWLAELPPAQVGTNFLNFTASHDGIGVRPLESHLPGSRVKQLMAAVQAHGGQISRRTGPAGQELPYELNITYFSALGEPNGLENSLHIRRFLTSQAIMLALRGIPAVYFHSLLATPNDHEGVRRTGRARSINRRKFAWPELEQLTQPLTTPRKVLDQYRRMLAVRIEQPAFHPDAPQEVLDLGNPALLAFQRTSMQGGQCIAVIANLSGRRQELDLKRHRLRLTAPGLFTSTSGGSWENRGWLEPYETVWLPVE